MPLLSHPWMYKYGSESVTFCDSYTTIADRNCAWVDLAQ